MESVVYHHAIDLGRYDLSENSQAPQKPPISYSQKITAEDFFKTILLIAKLTDCDVLYADKHKVRKKGERRQVQTKSSMMPATSLDGRVKLMLNGKGPFVKNKFVHAVVKEYIETHPAVSLKDLKKMFPRDLLGHWDNWELIEDNISVAKRLRDEGNRRHFLNEKDILKSGDNIPFVVCSQWDKNNLPNILSIVKQLGWSFSILQ